MDDPNLPQQVPVIIQVIVMAILFGGLWSWIWIITKKIKRQPLLHYEPRRPVPWSGIDLAIILIAFLAATTIAVTIAKQVLQANGKGESLENSPALIAASLGASLLTFLFSVAWVKLRAKATLSDIGIQPRRIGDDVAIGFVAFLAGAPVVYFIQFLVSMWIPYEHPLIDSLKEKPDRLTLGMVAVTAVIIAPMVEEFFFRVLLQGWLEKLETAIRTGRGDVARGIASDAMSPDGQKSWHTLSPGFFPIVVSSITFALLHWGQGAAPIPLFLFAFVLGWLYFRTHRWLPSLVAHLLLNLTSVAVLVLQLNS